MNLHRLYAFVLAFNPRGSRAFEKAGFVSRAHSETIGSTA